jgi:hypothetical protein
MAIFFTYLFSQITALQLQKIKADCGGSLTEPHICGYKGPTRGPFPTPDKGSRKLKAICGAQRMCSDQVLRQIAQALPWQDLAPLCPHSIQFVDCSDHRQALQLSGTLHPSEGRMNFH